MAVRLGGNGIRSQGTIFLRSPNDTGAGFDDRNKTTPCNEFQSQEPDVYCRGQLIITKLDLTAGIISSTFDFTLYKPGCDSIRVTHGRFDKKL